MPKKIAFLIICAFSSLACGAAAVEIDANGRQYASLQAYEASKKTAHAPRQSTPHELYLLSIENGMAGALQGFYQSQEAYGIPATRVISSSQLQDIIQQAVTGSAGPKLLISGPGKVRIMGMPPDNSEQ